MHIACESLAPGSNEIVRLLLDHGVQASGELSSTVDAKERVKSSSKCSQSVSIVNNVQDQSEEHDSTPSQITRSREPIEESRAFNGLRLQHKSDVNAVRDGQRPLSLSARTGNESLINPLIEHGAVGSATSVDEPNRNATRSMTNAIPGSKWTRPERKRLVMATSMRRLRLILLVDRTARHEKCSPFRSIKTNREISSNR